MSTIAVDRVIPYHSSSVSISRLSYVEATDAVDKAYVDARGFSGSSGDLRVRGGVVAGSIRIPDQPATVSLIATGYTSVNADYSIGALSTTADPATEVTVVNNKLSFPVAGGIYWLVDNINVPSIEDYAIRFKMLFTGDFSIALANRTQGANDSDPMKVAFISSALTMSIENDAGDGTSVGIDYAFSSSQEYDVEINVAASKVYVYVDGTLLNSQLTIPTNYYAGVPYETMRLVFDNIGASATLRDVVLYRTHAHNLGEATIAAAGACGLMLPSLPVTPIVRYQHARVASVLLDYVDVPFSYSLTMMNNTVTITWDEGLNFNALAPNVWTVQDPLPEAYWPRSIVGCPCIVGTSAGGGTDSLGAFIVGTSGVMYFAMSDSSPFPAGLSKFYAGSMSWSAQY